MEEEKVLQIDHNHVDIDDQGVVELKQQLHVCKLCEKGFPNGKSLGGHMRSHVIAAAAAYGSVKKLKKKKKMKKKKRENSINGDKGWNFDGVGYGLRENPKKTWRVVDASFNAKQERVCKQCGKGFQSLKALCGHMSCHSNKERNLSKVVYDDDDEEEDDDSWTDDHDDEDDDEGDEEEDKGFVMESHSDNNVAAVGSDQADGRRPRRSREVRYNSLGVDSLSLANGSSSNSEIDEEHEGAMCLMLLSRDFGRRKDVNVVGSGVNFTTESSDNNSMVLEGGSSSNHVGFSRSKDLKDGANGFHIAEMMRESASKKLKCLEMDNSDSGYFENGAKELESDGSVEGFARTNEYKKPEFDSLVHLENKDYGYARSELNHKLRSRIRSSLDYAEAQESSNKKIKLESVGFRAPNSVQRANKYECTTCHELFDTHQALGGHKMKYKRAGGCSIGSRLFNGELSIENNTSPNSDHAKVVEKKSGFKKTKAHKCPFCSKVFQSGQALGGHKRSHLIGAGSTSQMSMNPPSPIKEKPSLLDLNLPAPVDEEANAMPW